MRYESIKEFIENMDERAARWFQVGITEQYHVLTEEDYDNNTENVWHYEVEKSKKKISELDTMSGEEFVECLAREIGYIFEYNDNIGAILDAVKNGKSYKEIFIDELKVTNCAEYFSEFSEYLYTFNEL